MIACIGNSVADILVKPFKPKGRNDVLTVVENISLSIGGCAANAATVLGRMGAQVVLLGGIGDDPLGQFLFENIRDARVNLAGMVQFKGMKTSTSLVCIDSSGERSFFVQHGASKAYSLNDVLWDVIEKADHLHYGGFSTLPRLMGHEATSLLKRSKTMGKGTSLDMAHDASGKWLSDLEPALPFIDDLMMNREEGFHLTGEKDPEKITIFLKERGAQNVIIKLDREGSFLSGERGHIFSPAYPAEVQDATGAGDAFAAGFCLGLDMDLSIEDSLKLGNLFGALCIESLGATEAFISQDHVKNFIGKRDPQILASLTAKGLLV